MLSYTRSWIWTILAATLAIVFAGVGLTMNTVEPGAMPLFSSGLLLASLACTAAAFGRLVSRVRRLELENEGLIEEISQEFDRVKDKLEIFSEALADPRSISPEEAAEREADAPMRRVTIK